MKYKVGDRVIIRQWEDMEKEFGTNGNGNIKVPKGFLCLMKKHCGKTLTISQVDASFYRMVEDGKEWSWSDEMIEGMENMTKSDLKSGMVIEIRRGDRFLVVDKDGVLNFMGLSGSEYFVLNDAMKEDMSFSESGGFCDVMKIYAPCSTLNGCANTTNIIWERKKPKEMTMRELEKELGYPVKIIKEDRHCW